MNGYYESLLTNRGCDYFQSYTDLRAARQLLLAICDRHDLPALADVNKEVATKGAEEKWSAALNRFKLLILEESRHTVAEALHRRWYQSRYQNGLDLHIEFEKIERYGMGEDDSEGSEEENNKGPRCRAIFELDDIKSSKFITALNIKELLRPGTIIELCHVSKGNPKAESVLLGTLCHQVWTKETKPTILRNKCAITLYTADSDTAKSGRYRLYPLTSLLSYARQFEAITFLRTDLYPDLAPGPAERTHLGNNGEGAATNKSDIPSNSVEASSKATIRNTKRKDNGSLTSEATIFDIPVLNECQEKASRQFLTSSPGSVTLVQGPPGTGKTTLLTATICKFLLARTRAGNAHPRLMVCAPSNKAVMVLASRYLEAAEKSATFQVVMIGDKDKMMDNNDNVRRFKKVFVYSWVQNWLKDFYHTALSTTIKSSEKAVQLTLLADALYLHLPKHALHPDRRVKSLVRTVFSSINNSQKFAELEKALNYLSLNLRQMESIIHAHLLDNANVIFCTLSSAGTRMIKRTQTIEGLIIDEAAAACEPETYIPFASKRPEIAMIVGDPKQLPATVMSKLASYHGLGRSLQERLMFNEKKPYTMLRVQYRMRPEISQFPSAAFYQGQIVDGTNVIQPSYGSTITRSLVDTHPLCFIDVDGIEHQNHSKSFYNTKEAEQVVALLLDLRKISGGDRTQQPNTWGSLRRVRVITFYKAQVDLITLLMKTHSLNVQVSTVDSIQGSESELIVISFVRRGKRNSIGFLSDDRRLNVAITRAKHKLVCIGNTAGLATVEGRGIATVRALVQDAIDRKAVVTNYCPKVERRTRPAAVGPLDAHRKSKVVRSKAKKAANKRRRTKNDTTKPHKKRSKHCHRSK